MANVRAERLLKTPAEPSPELRIPGAAAQTRLVSMAGIRAGFWVQWAEQWQKAWADAMGVASGAGGGQRRR